MPTSSSEPRPLRVLVLIGRYLPVYSGAAMQQHEVLKQLGSERVEATVLTIRAPGTPRCEVIDGVRIVRLGAGIARRSARLWFALQVLWHILVRSRRYDVLHVFSAGWAGFLAPLAARLVALPSLFSSTLQGADDALSIRAQGLGAVKAGLMRMCRAVASYTPAQGKPFVEAGFSPDEVQALPVGIDDRFFSPGSDADCRQELRRQAGRNDEGPVILFIGTITRRKGVDLLLDTFEGVIDRHQGAVLVLMGPASRSEDPTLDESFVGALRERSETGVLANHVAFIGRVDSDERKRSILRAVDVFTLFSHAEGFGIVIVEAMACGVPSLLTPIPGVFDFVVTDGTDGRIARTREVGELSELLHELLADDERRNEMGRNARETVEQRFSMTRIAETYFDLYRRLGGGAA